MNRKSGKENKEDPNKKGKKKEKKAKRKSRLGLILLGLMALGSLLALVYFSNQMNDRYLAQVEIQEEFALPRSIMQSGKDQGFIDADKIVKKAIKKELWEVGLSICGPQGEAFEKANEVVMAIKYLNNARICADKTSDRDWSNKCTRSIFRLRQALLSKTREELEQLHDTYSARADLEAVSMIDLALADNFFLDLKWQEGKAKLAEFEALNKKQALVFAPEIMAVHNFVTAMSLERSGKIPESIEILLKAAKVDLRDPIECERQFLLKRFVSFNVGLDPYCKKWKLIKQEVESLLSSGKFEKLEALAEKYRSDKLIYFTGSDPLYSFYAGLEQPRSTPSSQYYLKRTARQKKWLSKIPKSSTARNALAGSLLEYAWDARGGGTADTVSEEGWRLMQERLAQAQSYLNQSRQLGGCDKQWYSVAQLVGRGSSMSRKDYFKMVNEGTIRHPRAKEFLFEAALYLDTRWFGEAGERERYITDQADKLGGEDGDVFYAQTVWHFDRMPVSGIVFDEENGFSWQRTKRGFKALLKRYPGSTFVCTEYLKLAARQNDGAAIDEVKKTLKPQFQS